MNKADKPDETPPAADRLQVLKLAIDLGPLLVFFAVYMTLGIYWATGVLMVTTVLSMILSRMLLGHISATLVMTTVLVVGFGALTFWFNDPRFIKMKPTIINLLFAIVLLGGLAMRRPVIQLLLGDALKLTDEGWRRLTLRWSIFFLGMAVLNELIWRNLSETTWASFKVFGILPLTMLFFISQYGLIQKYQLQESDSSSNSADR